MFPNTIQSLFYYVIYPQFIEFRISYHVPSLAQEKKSTPALIFLSSQPCFSPPNWRFSPQKNIREGRRDPSRRTEQLTFRFFYRFVCRVQILSNLPFATNRIVCCGVLLLFFPSLKKKKKREKRQIINDEGFFFFLEEAEKNIACWFDSLSRPQSCFFAPPPRKILPFLWFEESHSSGQVALEHLRN